MAHAYILLAKVKIKMGSYFEAKMFLKRAIQSYPTYTDLYYLLGITNRRLNNRKEAVEALDSAIRLGDYTGIYITEEGSGSYLSYYELGEIYREMENNPDAIKSYIQCIKTAPPSFLKAYEKIPICYEKLEKEELITKFLEEECLCSFHMAESFITHEFYKEALMILKRIPKSALKLELEISCFIQLGLYEIAQALLEQCFKIGKKKESLILLYIYCHWSQQLSLPYEFFTELKRNKKLRWISSLLRWYHDGDNLEIPNEKIIFIVDLMLTYRFVRLSESFISKIDKEELELTYGKRLFLKGYFHRSADNFLHIMKEKKLDGEGTFYLGEMMLEKGKIDDANYLFQEAYKQDVSRARYGISYCQLYKAYQLVSKAKQNLVRNSLLLDHLNIITEELHVLEMGQWRTTWNRLERRNKER
ncbi:tetratricopeptide repeat protein [Evansella tamaricis]|nr:tetratricopeptide repeat protein [Evansella tamaricis]